MASSGGQDKAHQIPLLPAYILQIESLGSQVRTASAGGTVTSSPQAQSRSFDSPTTAANKAASQSPSNGAPRQPQPVVAANAKRSGWVSIMGPQKRNPFEDLEFPPVGFKGFSLQKTFKVSIRTMLLQPELQQQPYKNVMAPHTGIPLAQMMLEGAAMKIHFCSAVLSPRATFCPSPTSPSTQPSPSS